MHDIYGRAFMVGYGEDRKDLRLFRLVGEDLVGTTAYSRSAGSVMSKPVPLHKQLLQAVSEKHEVSLAELLQLVQPTRTRIWTSIHWLFCFMLDTFRRIQQQVWGRWMRKFPGQAWPSWI